MQKRLAAALEMVALFPQEKYSENTKTSLAKFSACIKYYFASFLSTICCANSNIFQQLNLQLQYKIPSIEFNHHSLNHFLQYNWKVAIENTNIEEENFE